MTSRRNRSRGQAAQFTVIREIHLSGRIAAVFVCVALLAGGCRDQRRSLLRVGITPGPAEELLRSVEPELARQGLQLDIVTFSDYVQPNMALASHDVDANLYQNTVFLNQFNRDHQTHFVSLSKVYLPLMAIYPGRTKSLTALGNGARIAIPNDPVNHDRALLLLAKAGLLSVAQTDAATPRISANPKSIKLIELDAAQLPRSLDDVDVAVINANFALDAGLSPARNALLAETRESPYANVLAVNADAQSDSRFHALATALTSDETQAFITAHYGAAIYPAE
jgi:D-methionine transport system substrate-binding protein